MKLLKEIRFSKKSKIAIVFILGFYLTLMACFYDNEEELYPGNCVTGNVTYSGYVNTFIHTGCSCHTDGSMNGNVNLDTYNDVKKYIDNGLLMKSIKHESGAPPMPPSAKKTGSCDISKLEAWISNGAKQN